MLQALMLDGLVPKTVDAKARDCFVTLTGTAEWQYQRDEAEFLTASVPGVLGIDNDITLTSTPDGRDGGEEKAAPRELGGGGLAPICDTPGTYVYDH